MTWILLLPIALAAGTAVSMQFAVNSQLRGVAGGPVAAAAVSFVVGTVALLVLTLILNRGLPSFGDVAGTPWWVWVGGLLGAFYVFASVIPPLTLLAQPLLSLLTLTWLIASPLLCSGQLCTDLEVSVMSSMELR